VIENCIREGKPYIRFLQTHLTGCAKEKHLPLFRHLMQIIFNVAYTEAGFMLSRQESNDIIHFKTNNKDSIFNQTALNWANENSDEYMALELLKVEHDFHVDKKSGLQCLKKNLSRTALLPWMVQTYKNFYCQSQKLHAIWTVIAQLILLSYIPFILDVYLDINLIKLYSQAYLNETFDISELWLCGDIQLNCYFFNQTDTHSKFNEEIRHSFRWGSEVTILLLIITFISYNFNICYCDFIPNRVYHLISNDICLRDWPLKFGASSNKFFLLIPCCLVVFLIKTILFTVSFIISMYIWALFWPIKHIYTRYRYESSSHRSQHKEALAKNDAIWNNIKISEYGVEASLQLFLQLWLLRPFLSTITAWDATELLNRCVSGFGNFFTFEIHPACYVEKALVKIIMTIITLGLGVSQMKQNSGQGFSRTLPMFTSIVAQTVGRIYALKSLVLMTTGQGHYKYVIFLSSHAILVLLIKLFFERTSTFAYAGLSKSAWKIMNFLTSWMSSTIVMIHMHRDRQERGYFLLSYSLFHLLVLVENLTLACLPYLAESKYFPPPDCFTPESQLTAVVMVISMWSVGVIMHIVHYKLCHPWNELNGPSWKRPWRFTFLATFWWKKKVQIIKVDGFGWQCTDFRQG
jgi:hypothetical protein